MNAAVDIMPLTSPTDRLEPTLAALGLGRGPADERGFALPTDDPIARADGERGRGRDSDGASREAAEQIVGMAMIQPLLAQARRSPFKSERMHGGYGEDAFASRLDQTLADRLSKRIGGPIVEAVMRTLDPAGVNRTSDAAPGGGVDRHG